MPVDNLISRGDAGALIPEEVSREILKEMPKQSFALSRFRRMTLTSKTKRQPVMDTLPEAYWVNGDTGLKQTTEAAWSNKYIEAEELAVVVPIPEAVLEDADYDIWSEILPYIVEAFGRKVDRAVVFGIDRPASWPLSIVEGATAAGNLLVASPLSATRDYGLDVSDAMGIVESDGFAVTSHHARMQVKANLRGLRDQNRQPIFQPSLVAGTPNTLYAEPIEFSENGAWPAPASGVPISIHGNNQNAILGVRKDFSYRVFTEGVISDETGKVILNLMQQDSVAMRCVMRVGYQVSNAVTALNPNNATRYPFALVNQA